MGYILFVEDDQRIARIYQRVFKNSRHVIVDTAEAALDLLEKDPDVAVLMCDLNLQKFKMQGKEFLDLVRERRPQLSDRLVVMSGMDREDVMKMFAYPVGFVPKPASLSALRAAVAPFNPDPA